MKKNGHIDSANLTQNEMGTRGTVRLYDQNGNLSAIIYKHFDSYNLGKKLRQFASRFTLVNGIPYHSKTEIANGAGCLFATLIKELKDDVGDVYLLPASSLAEEEYNYKVIPEESSGKITVSRLPECKGEKTLMLTPHNKSDEFHSI